MSVEGTVGPSGGSICCFCILEETESVHTVQAATTRAGTSSALPRAALNLPGRQSE